MLNISVIIPCYNVGRFLSRAVHSCFAQSLKPFEIIIVDNNSSDNTMEVIKDLQKEYGNLIKVLSEIKQGASVARNKGLSIAKGDWIQFLDADDLLLSGKLDRQSKMIREDTDLIVGAASYRKTSGEEITILPKEDLMKGIFKGEFAGNTCSNLWSKKVLERVGGWNEDLKNTQDYDLLFRIAQLEPQVIFDMEPGSVHIDREEGQISKSDPKGNVRRAMDLRLRMVDFLKEHHKEYWRENSLYYLQLLLTFIRNWARFDLDNAHEIFKKYLPNNFKPLYHPEYYHKKLYSQIFPLLGFKNSERLLSMRRKILGFND